MPLADVLSNERRNRRWGSLRNSVNLRVQLSQRTKEILSALRNCESEQISYGAVIEKLAEQYAEVLKGEVLKGKTQAANELLGP